MPARGPEVVERNFAAADDTPGSICTGWPSRPVRSRSATIRCHWLPAAASLSSGSRPGCWRAGRSDPRLHAAGGWHFTLPPPAASRSGISPADPHLAIRYLHPVRQLRLRLPPWGAAGQVLPSGTGWQPPRGNQSVPVTAKGFPDSRYTLQLYPEDCTGCGQCVQACPVRVGADEEHEGERAITMMDKAPIWLARSRRCAGSRACRGLLASGWISPTVRGAQFLEPLFRVLRRLRRLGETFTSSC